MSCIHNNNSKIINYKEAEAQTKLCEDFKLACFTADYWTLHCDTFSDLSFLLIESFTLLLLVTTFSNSYLTLRSKQEYST